MSLFEWAIIAFIIVSILWHVWKGGSANPEGTRSLGKKVTGLSNRVGTLSTRVGHVEDEIEDLKNTSASTEDIAQLEKLVNEKFNTIDAKIEGQKQLSQGTARNVQRIYDIMLQKGLGK